MADDPDNSVDRPSDDGDASKPEKMFTLKKWNAVAMWSWDVECDICAICRVQVMGSGSSSTITMFTAQAISSQEIMKGMAVATMVLRLPRYSVKGPPDRGKTKA